MSEKGWNPMANKTTKTPKTPSDASLQSTKQMLDELDALMEKMLALPVNDLDDAAAFPAPTLTLLEPPSVPNPAPAQSEPAAQTTQQAVREAPSLALRAGVAAPEPAVPLPFNPPHFELPAAPASEPESLQFDAPAPEPLTNEVMPVSVLSNFEPLLQEIADPPTSLQTRWLYQPLMLVNQGFDRTTLVLGGAGRWLRSEAGRMLLGLSGIALMVAAVVWLLKDWLGWNW